MESDQNNVSVQNTNLFIRNIACIYIYIYIYIYLYILYVPQEYILYHYSELMESNVKKCEERCVSILIEYHQPIENKVRKGIYMKNGGHQEYKNDISDMEQKFKAMHGQLSVKVGKKRS